jgi:hypothetical protein
MVATVAAGISGVEYYFDETTGRPGGTDSGWQDGTAYEDTGLLAGTTYAYRVKTRARSSDHSETDFSEVVWAATGTRPSQTPNAPAGLSPADGAENVNVTVVLQSSAFGDPDAGDTHQATRWQVDDDSDFSSPAWDDTDLDADKTAAAVPADMLAPATTYYWRVRHQDSGGMWSAWSDAQSFTTAPCHPVDVDHNWVVSDFELLDYIDLWVGGSVGDFELLNTIGLWVEGRYGWVQEAGSYLFDQLAVADSLPLVQVSDPPAATLFDPTRPAGWDTYNYDAFYLRPLSDRHTDRRWAWL